MKWLEQLADGLERHAGLEVREKVMEGQNTISKKTDPMFIAKWVQRAMNRLDRLVEDKEIRRKIMLTCSDLFPKERIEKLREEYHQTHDLDAVIKMMHEDNTWHGLSYYEYPSREGNTIYVTKIPFDPQGFKTAKNQGDRLAAYCHCPLVREAVRKRDFISSTFCLCGSGWYKSLWEGILGKSVQVEVIETVAEGGQKCCFAIHLPI